MPHSHPRIALFAALFLLSGCAPMMTALLVMPFEAGNTREFGASGNGLYQLLDAKTASTRNPETHANAQFWYRSQSPTFETEEYGYSFAAGTSSLLSGGAYKRTTLKNEPGRFYIAHQIEGGWLWAGVSLPMAFSVTDNFWISTQPSLRYTFIGLVQVPLGFHLNMKNGYRLDAEGGVHAFGVNMSTVADPGFHNRLYAYGGLGLAKQW
jgi:hypothetical protein